MAPFAGDAPDDKRCAEGCERQCDPPRQDVGQASDADRHESEAVPGTVVDVATAEVDEVA
ncbi:MAG: hypothetical protein JWP14_566 [Frankiales bacterium]|nr:hypothetical protein [Frankiales bacterium]